MQEIPLALIVKSRWQPRSPKFDEEELWELAKSIRENGLLNPVIVFPGDNGDFELVAGERRTRATIGLALGDILDNHTPKEYVYRMAHVGLTGMGTEERRVLAEHNATIKANVESGDDMRRLHLFAVIENIERSDLNGLEEARALRAIMDSYSMNQREIAQRLGKSQGWVGQRLRLLELPEQAQEAMGTRVLNLTHARALQGIPEAVASATVDYVTRKVERGASTREVETVVQDLKTFLDPDRYLPRRRYPQAIRNRLDLVRWLVSERAEENANEIVRRVDKWGTADDADGEVYYRMTRIAAAFGFDSVDAAWEAFALAENRLCVNCRWNQWHWDGDEWPFGYRSPPCELMRDDVATCERFIGYEDPEVIELNWRTIQAYAELGIEYHADPFNHVIGIEQYVENFGRVQAHNEREKSEEEIKRQIGHIAEIERYYEWVISLPDEAVAHVRAHACPKCTHYQEDAAPPYQCILCPPPNLTNNGHRAPQFGAFVMEDGLVLPRCELFAYPERPEIKRVPGTKFVDQEQVMGWVRALAGERRRSINYIWYRLQWIDYYRKPGQDEHLDLLIDYLSTIWMMPAVKMDELIPTLLDVVASEADPSTDSFGVIQLVNPTTGERERFAPVSLDIIWGDREFPYWKSYPEDWPRPWEDNDAE